MILKPHELTDLLALAAEIAREEALPRTEAWRRALQLWPDLAADDPDTRVAFVYRDGRTKFHAGAIVATSGALAALTAAGASASTYLQRHLSGDWGDISDADRQENEFSVEHGLRILSAYTLPTGIKIWLMTEADRSATTILLPSEY
jgi:hypothetical protein